MFDGTFLFGVVLFATLFTIAFFDFSSMRIPNILNLTLAVSGCGWQIVMGQANILFQIFFSGSLLLFFWAVRFYYHHVSGRQGLGLGDVKMAGAAGLWIAPINFPVFVFLASVSGLLYGLFKVGRNKVAKIPFGPFLAIGLFLTWLWENYQ